MSDLAATQEILDKLTSFSLGTLLAFYERRTFVSGAVWYINVFDQMGMTVKNGWLGHGALR